MVAATTISPPSNDPVLPLQDPTAPYVRIGRLLMSGSFGPLVGVPALAVASYTALSCVSPAPSAGQSAAFASCAPQSSNAPQSHNIAAATI